MSLTGGLYHSVQSDCRDIDIVINFDWCVDVQVYDRLAQTDVTVELVAQLFSAMYSAAAADEVFSSSREYDGMRMVIDMMCHAWCCDSMARCVHVHVLLHVSLMSAICQAVTTNLCRDCLS